MEDPVAAALARLSKAQAKCAKELLELTASHADSPAWASAGIAAVVRLCHDPAAAADAVAVLGCLSEADDANDDLIREAGAIPLLLTLLIGGPASGVAAHVARALGNLAYGDATGVAAIIEAGAIPTLAAMLSGGPESTAPHFAAYALQNLASDSEAARAAIVETGAIVPLLALLRGGPESRAANRAAGVLCNLSVDDEGRNAVVEAGAISPLLALLRGGPESRAAQRAAGALQNLSSGTNATAVLEEVARTQIDCSFWEGLRKKLRARASEELQAAEAGSAVAALEHAITLAAAVQVDASAVERAQARLREINGDAERQERRESFGLGSLALPDEFMCPITMDKMRGVPPPPSPPAALAHRRRTRAPLAPQTRWWRPTATHMSGRPSSRCSANATP